MDSANSENWRAVLALLRQSESFDEGTMKWLESTSLFKIESGRAFVSYRSRIACSLLQEHQELFESTLGEVWGSPLKITLISQHEMEEMLPDEALRQKTSRIIGQGFDDAYTFDSFVQGPSNREALSACRAVCQPQSFLSLNPLLIYGNSGLGKTHMLNALGNELKSTHPERKVIYLYAGDLVSLLIEAMRAKNTSANAVEEIKEQLLDCDYFLIDDIQNLRSASCQEVFFTIFNELIRRKKQIVITSDTHPSKISALTKRLISRFSSGLIVCISKPEAQTAVLILKKKMTGKEDILPIDDDVLEYLAMGYSDDVRALEGALNRLIFSATIYHAPKVTMEFALSALRDEPFAARQNEITPAGIKNLVAASYGLSMIELEGKSRQKKLTQARQICMYLMREMTDLSYTAIGHEMGGRDHTTVSSSCSRVRQMMKKETDWKNAVENLKQKLTS